MNNYIWNILGYKLKCSINELNYIKSLPKELFDNHIKTKRNEIYQFHLKNNKWYRRFVGRKEIINWEDIPLIRKQDLQFFSDNKKIKWYDRKKYYFANTSGSSGHPLTFWKNKFCHSIAWANIINSYSDLGITSADIEGRFFGSIKHSYKYKIRERIKDALFNRIRFDVFDISDNKMDEYISIFCNNNIGYIYGYTNVILEFSRYIIRKKAFTIKNICPSLKLCILTAEMCIESDKEVINKAFGVPVYNEYGSSETSIVAIEDMAYNWRISTERLWVEILDENNQPVKEGELGNIVITDLYNEAFPFIRYDIGDIASIQKIANYPYLLLDDLWGRISDIILLPSGKRSPGLTFYYVLRTILDQKISIKEFKIIQQDYNYFIFIIQASIKLKEQEERVILEAVDHYLESGLIIKFKYVDKIDEKYSNKIQNFFSNIHSK